jgi:transcriptional regulator with XRE-family HTH domain
LKNKKQSFVKFNKTIDKNKWLKYYELKVEENKTRSKGGKEMNLTLLKSERIKRGITQEKLAKLLGFKDKSSYCLIEKGKTAVSVDTANKIALHLGLSKDVTYEIFFEQDVQDASTSLILAQGGERENGKCNSEDKLQHIL